MVKNHSYTRNYRMWLARIIKQKVGDMTHFGRVIKNIHKITQPKAIRSNIFNGQHLTCSVPTSLFGDIVMTHSD